MHLYASLESIMHISCEQKITTSAENTRNILYDNIRRMHAIYKHAFYKNIYTLLYECKHCKCLSCNVVHYPVCFIRNVTNANAQLYAQLYCTTMLIGYFNQKKQKIRQSCLLRSYQKVGSRVSLKSFQVTRKFTEKVYSFQKRQCFLIAFFG